IERGEERLVRLEEVEALLASETGVVDACRHVVHDRGQVASLATRPALLALARALGDAWAGDVASGALVARAFGSKRVDESHGGQGGGVRPGAGPPLDDAVRARVHDDPAAARTSRLASLPPPVGEGVLAGPLGLGA